MSVQNHFEFWAKSCGWGMLRAASVEIAVYPLEVMKFHRQIGQSSLKVFRAEGILPFYRGLSAQLGKIVVKQPYLWPIITTVPPILKQQGIGDLGQWVLTGVSIATLDTILTKHFEGKKIEAVLASPKSSWKVGLANYWSKQTGLWCSMLVAQCYFRTCAMGRHPEEPLRVSDLIGIGIGSAAVVSTVVAPLDRRSTLTLARMQHLLSGGIGQSMRGSVCIGLRLAAHNIATAILVDKLKRSPSDGAC